MRNKLIKLSKYLLKLAESISSEDWIALYDAYEDYLNPDSRMYDKQKINNLLDPFIDNLIMEIRKRNNETESDLHKRIENRLIELENANSIEKKMMYIDIIKSMYHHMGPLTDYFSDEYYKRQRHTFNYISNRKNMQEIYTDSIYTDPDVAYEYALKELKGSRFPEGEPIIATSAQHSYLYAWNVIRKRFPMGEDAISTDDYYSLRYAKDVLKLYPNEAKSWREKYLAGETKELV